jgi:hypothetical protein
MNRIAAIAGFVMGTACSPVVIDFPGDSGLSDPACTAPYFPDADGDGYGAAEAEPVLACRAPEGTAAVANDCDDDDPAVQPGALERCNGLDDDCDGLVDEGAASPATWYADADGDGYGDPATSLEACAAPDGFVASALDCDDADGAVHPGALERCDGQDQDCDGAVDEACSSCDLTVPGGFSTVQAAIDAAPAGATICVGPGTWAAPLDVGARDIALVGTQGAVTTVLDAGGRGSVVRAGGGRLTLTGFTLTGGRAERGGGVEVRGGEAILADILVVGCTADRGGAIHLDGAQTTLTDVGIEDCEAESGGGIDLVEGEAHLAHVAITGTRARVGHGGGIAAERATLALEEVRVERAEAIGGGGIVLVACAATARGVALVDDVAGVDGGGGLLMAGGTLTAEDLRLDGNLATGGSGGGVRMKGGRLVGTRLRFAGDVTEAGDGGGLHLESAEAELSWVSFEDDAAAAEGGAICLTAESDLRLSQGVLVGCRAKGGGAVQVNDTASAVLDHVLVASNRATAGPGGALGVADSAVLEVTSAIFTDNAAIRGAALALRDAASLHLSSASLHANPGAASVQAEGTPGSQLVLAGVSLTDSAPWPAVAASPSLSYDLDWINVHGAGARPLSGLGPRGRVGTLLHEEPAFLDTASPHALAWDLHLDPGSGLMDASDPALSDPDGSRADVGAWGSPEAATWDLDGDGAPSWWQPGVYDRSAYPVQGWDCDDLDPTVLPGSGC